MTKKLVVVVSGGALAFALAGVASPGIAWGSVHPAGVAQATLLKPDGTPVIRDSNARLALPGHMKISAPPGTPIIRDSTARLGHPGHMKIWAPGDPPVIRRSISAPPDTPVVRGSNAQQGDPDDGGQIVATTQTGDPDDGGQ